MATQQPPAWEESDSCKQCKQVYSFLSRRHHCRRCGGSVCGSCSSQAIPLPQFGFAEPVRVCDACYRAQKQQAGKAAAPARAARRSAKPDTESESEAAPEPEPVQKPPPPRVKNCTCGMPLCVCPDDPVEDEPTEKKKKNQQKKDSKPQKREEAARPAVATESKTGAATASRPGLFFSSGPATASNDASSQYDLKGNLEEQCRDAVKARDADGVRVLLDAGCNAKYADRTGNTLVHLAAMFNRLDIIEMLVAKGADVSVTNHSQETPIDLAPPALAAKMEKMKK